MKRSVKTICLCHDIERGLGHRTIDPAFAEYADTMSHAYLKEILLLENKFNIKATYHLLGCLFNELHESIQRNGHSIGFHSYDHNINLPQLSKCRQTDKNVKGYRPPQSYITPELNTANLLFHGFEWLASSAGSLGIRYPEMRSGIVTIPILFDDYGLYTRKMKYKEWEDMAIRVFKDNDFVSFSLHDCYAHHWLPYIPRFLTRIAELGTFKTLDEVAREVMASAL